MNWDDFTWNLVLECCNANTVRSFLCTCKRFHRIMHQWQYARYKCLPYLTDSYLEALAIMDNPDLFQLAIKEGLIKMNSGVPTYLHNNYAFRILESIQPTYVHLHVRDIKHVIEVHATKLYRQVIQTWGILAIRHSLHHFQTFNRPKLHGIFIDGLASLEDPEVVAKLVINSGILRAPGKNVELLRRIMEQQQNNLPLAVMMSRYPKRRKLNDFV